MNPRKIFNSKRQAISCLPAIIPFVKHDRRRLRKSIDSSESSRVPALNWRRSSRGFCKKRLRAFVLFFAVVMGLGLCSSFILPFPDLFVFHTPFPLLRLAVLGGLVTAYFFLRKKSKLPLGALRWLEIAVLAAIGLTLLLASSQRILRFAEIGDVASTSFGRAMILTIWSVLILLYGMFIPNSWRRAAMVLLPFAAIPYLNVLYLRWVSPEAAAIFDLNRFVVPIPLPFLAFSAAVYISHLIQSIRREAFAARQLGQYRLQKKLGAGGMGEVYTAEHVLLKRPCAVKLIQLSPDSDANILTRFEREVRANAKLSHWNTVDIFDYGYTADGIFYYSMELLPGLCLQRLVDRYGLMPPERAIYLLRQICRALTEAHEDFGIVHRDIKPANIFASKRGGLYDVAKILDFGLVTQQGVEAPDQDDPLETEKRQRFANVHVARADHRRGSHRPLERHLLPRRNGLFHSDRKTSLHR